MVDPISDYISPISPLPNIAPFTYKDGATYLSELERFRKYVNEDLVVFINTNFAYFDDTFTTEINALIQQVDNVLAAQNTENEANLAAVNAAIAAMNAAITTAETSIAASVTAAAGSATAAAGSATAASGSATAASGSASSAATSATAAAASAALGYIHSVVAGSHVTVDSTDPHNPIVAASLTGGGAGIVETIVAGTNVTVDSTDPANPIVSSSGGGGGGTVDSVVAGDNITVDSTDPANPVVSVDSSVTSTPNSLVLRDGSGGINDTIATVVAGSGVTVDDTDPKNPVISASGGGGGGTVDSVVAGASGHVTIDNTDPANPIIEVAGSTTYNAANTLVERDSDGQTSVKDPVAAHHAASKNYVDHTIGGATATAADIVFKPSDPTITIVDITGKWGVQDDDTSGSGNILSAYAGDTGAKLTALNGSNLAQVIAFNGEAKLVNGAVSDPDSPFVSVTQDGAFVNGPFSPGQYVVGSEPTASEGQLIYYTDVHKLAYYNGTAWIQI